MYSRTFDVRLNFKQQIQFCSKIFPFVLLQICLGSLLHFTLFLVLIPPLCLFCLPIPLPQSQLTSLHFPFLAFLYSTLFFSSLLFKILFFLVSFPLLYLTLILLFFSSSFFITVLISPTIIITSGEDSLDDIAWKLKRLLIDLSEKQISDMVSD